MARITFQSEKSNQSASISEWEVRKLIPLKMGIAWSGLEHIVWGSKKNQLINYLLPKDHYVLNSDDREDSAGAFFKVTNGSIRLNKRKIHINSLMSNTAYVLGSDPIKLFVRISDCLFPYIRKENFNWITEIINIGLQAGVYKRDNGWEDVIQLLENSQEVVTYTSGFGYFPNPDFIGMDEDEWNNATWKNKWIIGMRY